MARLLIVGCFWLGFSALSLGQSLPGRWAFGIRTGLTVAGVNRSAIRSVGGLSLSDIRTSSVETFQLGLVANRALSRRFSVQSELLYSVYGGEVEGSVQVSTVRVPIDVSITIGTIELPLLLKASFGRGRWRGFVNGGAFGAYSVNYTNTLGTTLVPDLTRKLFYGLAGGVGLSVLLGPGQLVLESRYNYSLGDNARLDFGGGRLHYQVAGGSLGYLILF